MELFLLYVWTRLGAVQGVVVASVLLFGFFATCLVFARFVEGSKESHKLLKPAYTGLIVSVVLMILIPSKQDAAIIAGGWLVKEASQSEITKTIGERTYKLIIGKLDEELAALEAKGKK